MNRFAAVTIAMMLGLTNIAPTFAFDLGASNDQEQASTNFFVATGEEYGFPNVVNFGAVSNAPGADESLQRPPLESQAPQPLQGGVVETAKAILTAKIQQNVDGFSILAGSMFPVRLTTSIDSKTAKPGDKIIAVLEEDLRTSRQTFATKGALLEGVVVGVHHACNGIKTNKPNAHFRDANGGVTFKFTTLVAKDGNLIQIGARPSPNSKLVAANPKSQKLHINGRRELAIPYHAGRMTVISVAIAGGSSACGPFGMAGAPVISAAIAAIYPSYGLGRPRRVGEKYGRFKAIAMGALRGTPGGFITSSLFVKGLDFQTGSGDVLMVRLDNDVLATKESLLQANATRIQTAPTMRNSY